MRTAWVDKHPAYDLLNGPSGVGVDDLFAPEVDAHSSTSSMDKIKAYDDTKAAAIINEIDGKDHTGEIPYTVPALFGMNFQAVSVAMPMHRAHRAQFWKMQLSTAMSRLQKWWKN
jgi:hypothetical protein